MRLEGGMQVEQQQYRSGGVLAMRQKAREENEHLKCSRKCNETSVEVWQDVRIIALSNGTRHAIERRLAHSGDDARAARATFISGGNLRAHSPNFDDVPHTRGTPHAMSIVQDSSQRQ